MNVSKDDERPAYKIEVGRIDFPVLSQFISPKGRLAETLAEFKTWRLSADETLDSIGIKGFIVYASFTDETEALMFKLSWNNDA